jgi:hypothetical protein
MVAGPYVLLEDKDLGILSSVSYTMEARMGGLHKLKTPGRKESL